MLLVRAPAAPPAPQVGDLLEAGEVPGPPASLPQRAYGTRPELRPQGDVVVGPDDDLVAAVASAPPGSTVVLAPGVHRIAAPLRPADGLVVIGAGGAVLSGAVPLDDLRRTEEGWSSPPGTAPRLPRLDVDDSPVCRPSAPECDQPVTVFVGSRRLDPVAPGERPGPGEALLHADGRVVLGADPAGEPVEVAVTPAAFVPGGDDVTVANLIIERFATTAQSGAVGVEEARGWRVIACELRDSAAAGVYLGPGGELRDSWVHHQGQIGVKGAGEGVVVIGNRIDRNNTARFDDYWEAGGSKLVRTRDLILSGNWVHDNDGPGIWTDIDNVDARIEGNLSERNARAGIWHEISFAATIRGNLARDNGTAAEPQTDTEGAGIIVANSSDVLVEDNEVRGNGAGIVLREQERGGSELGPWVLDDVVVRDNLVVMAEGFTGIKADEPAARDLVFEGNRYVVTDRPAFRLEDGRDVTLSRWRAAGNDVTTVPGRAR